MSGKAVREVSGFRVGIEDPHQRQVAQRKRRAHLIDHLVSVVCITANPGHAVRPGDRIVRVHRDSVPRRIDDLYPGRRRLLAVVVELDPRRMGYCGHARILASPRALGHAPSRRDGGRRRLAGPPGGLRCRGHHRASRPRERAGRARRAGDWRSRLYVCLARAGGLAEKPAYSRVFHHHGVSMDSLHAIGFYVSSGVLLIGGLGVALLPGRELRGAALAVVGVGLGGLYVSLAAGFAAVVALLCYLACGALVAGPRYRSVEVVGGPLWRQVGALGAAGLLVVIIYPPLPRGLLAPQVFVGGFRVLARGRRLPPPRRLGRA